MFVPDEIWVTANFKETRLDAMRPDHAPAELDAERWSHKSQHRRRRCIRRPQQFTKNCRL
jgi:membrane fusion protein (multidrug efflux system)